MWKKAMCRVGAEHNDWQAYLPHVLKLVVDNPGHSLAYKKLPAEAVSV
jgi:hypothetical protein